MVQSLDSGAEITIMDVELFWRVAAVAELKRSQLIGFLRHDCKDFSLDGHISASKIAITIYVNLDAANQLLLGEGVCTGNKHHSLC